MYSRRKLCHHLDRTQGCLKCSLVANLRHPFLFRQLLLMLSTALVPLHSETRFCSSARSLWLSVLHWYFHCSKTVRARGKSVRLRWLVRSSWEEWIICLGNINVYDHCLYSAHIYPWDTQLLQGCWYLYNSINLDSALQTRYAVVVINSRAAGQNFQLFLVSYTPQVRCVASQVKELKERKYSY